MSDDATHFEQAEYCIQEADNRASVEAGRECLMAAGVHALLAIAETIDRKHPDRVTGLLGREHRKDRTA